MNIVRFLRFFEENCGMILSNGMCKEKKNENKLPRSIFGAKNVLYTLEEDLLQGKKPDSKDAF